jgi:hypothetical protein
MVQAMHLISGETLMRQTTAKGGNLDKWMADSSLTDEDVVRKIFLAAVVREPDHREIEAALLPLQAKGAESRRQAFEDVLWTVFNSKEFLFNH